MKRPASIGLMLLLVSSAGTALAQGLAAPVDEPAGRAVAHKVCASCHLVSDGPQRAPFKHPPAPSFSHIANLPGVTSQSLLAFLKTRHHSEADWRKMPGLKTSDEQSEAVVRYIMTLRKTPR